MTAENIVPVERRAHERFVMRGDTFAFLQSPANRIGQLVDISLSGLAFTYFSITKASLEADGLDILADGEIFIKDISYRMIEDFVLPNKRPFSQITMRRCCVQFDSLTPAATREIMKFIDKYAINSPTAA